MLLPRRTILRSFTLSIISGFINNKAGAKSFSNFYQKQYDITKNQGSLTKNTEQNMKHIVAGDLEVAYFETGPSDGSPIILLHGFPYDAHAYDEASKQLVASGKRCIVPFLRGYGETRFLSTSTFRSGQQAALGQDLLNFMDALKISRAVLAGYDWGGRAACIVSALYPDRVQGLVSCGTAYNIQNTTEATAPLEPKKEQLNWYWFYLNSERGKTALSDKRDELCRDLWQTFSPSWKFDDKTFDETVTSFNNPDFVDVVIHSYRFRIGSVPGDLKLDSLEKQISSQPQIKVPTVILQGAEDGVDQPESSDSFSKHFTNILSSKTLLGIGHNLPQEAPKEFAAAVLSIR